MSALKCNGVGRDKDCVSALQFYFSRPVTDDEMRFLHDVMKRAVASAPSDDPLDRLRYRRSLGLPKGLAR